MRQALRKMTAVTILMIVLLFAIVALVVTGLSALTDYLLKRLGVEDHENGWWG